MPAENQIQVAPAAGLVAVCALCAALLLALPMSSARAATCANEAIRVEQGSAALGLPDCRAYEFVSPGSTPSITKDSKLEFGGGKASPAGDALSFFSRYPAEGSQTSSETWLSRRSAAGWALTSIDPQMTPTPTQAGECQPGVAFSEDLDTFLLSAGGDLETAKEPSAGECGKPAEELATGEPRGYANLYLRRGDAPYELVNPVPVGMTPANATYLAASSDLSRVVFSEIAQLTPEAVPGSDLYEWADGIVRLIGVLPNGEPVPAKLGAATQDWGDPEGFTVGLAPVSHAVSVDGERVFFEANGNLYLRKNAGQAPAANANCLTTSETGLACTLQIDVSKGADSSGGGVFQFASTDGDRVFFLSDHALTFPSSAAAGKPDLYEYDVSAKKLVDLTVASSGNANVRGISGGSDDGSRLYFVARGILTGSQQNQQGEVAQAGQPNLYLVHDGSLTYVATLSLWEGGSQMGGVDRYTWWETEGGLSFLGLLNTAWSPSGKYLVFSSFKPLTGFDSSPAEPGACGAGAAACKELFLYDSEADELSCLSCDPGGANPVDNTQLVVRQEFLRFLLGPQYAPRVVLDTGQVYFDTENSLSPGDVNGFQDVYEFHAGNVNLISSGTAKGGSTFVDASVDADDVFFITPESLVRSDDDGGLPSIYDARIDGGFAEPPLPPASCSDEESCRSGGSASPPAAAPASTAAFIGPGNVKAKPCKHGKVRRGKKCVKKKKAPRHHHRTSNSKGNS